MSPDALHTEVAAIDQAIAYPCCVRGMQAIVVRAHNACTRCSMPYTSLSTDRRYLHNTSIYLHRWGAKPETGGLHADVERKAGWLYPVPTPKWCSKEQTDLFKKMRKLGLQQQHSSGSRSATANGASSAGEAGSGSDGYDSEDE
eukprot:5646-Heterococcus_DN1.PRE.2